VGYDTGVNPNDTRAEKRIAVECSNFASALFLLFWYLLGRDINIL
jgi:hypothetical protein